MEARLCHLGRIEASVPSPFGDKHAARLVARGHCSRTRSMFVRKGHANRFEHTAILNRAAGVWHSRRRGRFTIDVALAERRAVGLALQWILCSSLAIVNSEKRA